MSSKTKKIIIAVVVILIVAYFLSGKDNENGNQNAGGGGLFSGVPDSIEFNLTESTDLAEIEADLNKKVKVDAGDFSL